MDDLSCSGSEKDIGDCTFSGWTTNNCGHTEDVGVSCGLYQTVYTFKSKLVYTILHSEDLIAKKPLNTWCTMM